VVPNEAWLLEYLGQPEKRTRLPPTPHAAMIDNAPEVLRAIPDDIAITWWRPLPGSSPEAPPVSSHPTRPSTLHMSSSNSGRAGTMKPLTSNVATSRLPTSVNTSATTEVGPKAASNAVDSSLLPLVTVMVLTCNRPQHVLLALRQIEAQDYRPLEALVVDDGTAQLKRLLRNAYPAVEILSTPLLPSDATNASARLMVRLLSLPYRASIGEKRALAVRSARGKVILHWDDDDFHQERRVSAQALPIIRGEADLSALELTTMVTMPNRQFYTVRGVHGPLFASLAYSASLGRVLSFADVSLGEDLDFAERAVQACCCSLKLPLPPRLCHF
jgi:hypothetical protein